MDIIVSCNGFVESDPVDAIFMGHDGPNIVVSIKSGEKIVNIVIAAAQARAVASMAKTLIDHDGNMSFSVTTVSVSTLTNMDNTLDTDAALTFTRDSVMKGRLLLCVGYSGPYEVQINFSIGEAAIFVEAMNVLIDESSLYSEDIIDNTEKPPLVMKPPVLTPVTEEL